MTAEAGHWQPGGEHPRGGHPRWGGPSGDHREASPHFDADSGPFGVKRPLRFLAWKLELEEPQIAALATILDALKTERAQAAVDHRRSVASFADALLSATFDAEKAEAAGVERVKSAERLKTAVVRTLEQLHGLLDEEQRKRLSYLLRTGALGI